MTKAKKAFVSALYGWTFLTSCLVLAANWSSPTHAAIIKMALGLILLWCCLGGWLMWRFREPISNWVRRSRLDWRIKFVLFCTLLAMVEEAVTTGMTNCAPLFGVKVGEAYITSSANYLDVITFHSVSVFVSLFVGWAVILWRYDFSPFAVFVLFGISGTLAEMAYGGPQHALEYPMWNLVYGLMVWLPARSIPSERKARKPRWWHYPLAVFVPFLFMGLFPLAALIHAANPGHPDPHFPPLR
jgi:hypothetical protein